MDRFSNVSFSNICRICTQSNDELDSIFNLQTDLGCSFSKAVMECASIDVSEDDGLPTQICGPCKINLSSAYSFRLQCIESNTILRDYLENLKLKLQEPDEDIDEVIPESDTEVPVEVSDESILRRKRKRKKINKNPPWCEQCQMTFVSHTNLLRHLNTHNGEKRLSCETCGKQFATAAYVKAHMVVHSKERKYSCNTCGKTFMFSSDLTIHMRKHTGERPFVCEICAKRFVSSSALNAHRFKHGPKRFFCCVCKKGFIYKLELNSHITIHKKDQFIIVDNDENLSSVEEPDDLDKTLMKKERDPIKITKENLVQFQNEIEKLKESKHDFQCDLCSKKLSSLSNLHRHKLVHSSVKPHICGICNKGFKLNIDLVNHKNRHLGIRNIACEYCPKMFASRSDYGKHVTTHMSYKPYNCDECSKSYYNVYALNYHKKQHNLPFKCEIDGCSKSYQTTEQLGKHLKLQHDDSKQQYKCDLCDKVLSNMNSLTRHLGKVHNVKEEGS